MKKSLYIAAALLLMAGCAKEEVTVSEQDSFNIGLSVGVNTVSSKAVFDGVDALKFEKGDKLGAALAKIDDPYTIVKVAKNDQGAANSYGSTLTIEDPDAEKPVFTGGFYDVEEKNFADLFNVYYYFPASAFETGESPANWVATVKKEQKGYQDHWDKESDALIGVPSVVNSADARYYEQWKEYSFDRGVSTELAHLFGFGKLTFADVPTEYADYEVNSVVIEAVGENKKIAGTVKVDISKSVSAQEYTTGSSYSTITITPQETVKVKDNVVWFVAVPGTFDVKVTVKTFRGDLVFERSGLEIVRGKIAAPIVHYKETDAAVSHDVVLTSRQNWTNDNFNSNYISSNNVAPMWGPSGAEMAFSLAYPGSKNNNYGSYLSSNENYYVRRQMLAYQNILGGKVVLYSRAAFHNVEMVKIGLGIYNDNEPSCDYTLALVNGADTTVLKKINFKGEATKTTDYKTYFVENTTEVKNGDLVLIVDNISADDIKPILGLLTINPVPEIEVGATKVNVEKEAVSGEILCIAHATTSVPSVESSESWLTVSYADNKITYNVAANDGGKRTAVITVKVVDGESIITKEISVVQKSATSVEYKLTITPQAVKPFTDAVLEKTPDATSSKITATFTAVATDGSGKTQNVEIYADYIMLKDITDEYFKLRYDLKNTTSMGFVEKVVITADSKVGNSTYGLNVAYSTVGGGSSNYKVQKDVTVEGGSPFVSTIVNENEDNGFFKLNTGYSYTPIRKVEVYYIND